MAVVPCSTRGGRCLDRPDRLGSPRSMPHEAAHTVEGRAEPGTGAVASVKAGLAAAVADAVRRRQLTQTEAARLCGTDQPTLSKVLRSGRLDLVSVDKLLSWLAALGVDVELCLTAG